MVAAKTRAENLKIIRTSLGFTQEKLSRELHTSQNNYSYYESGRNSDVEFLITTAEKLGLPAETITELNLPAIDAILSRKRVKYQVDFSMLFPIFHPGTDKANADFEAAYNGIKELHELMAEVVTCALQDREPDMEMFALEDPYELFKKIECACVDEDFPEAIANLFPILFYYMTFELFEDAEETLTAKYENTDFNRLLPVYLCTIRENKEEKELYQENWQSFREIFYELHKGLRSYPEWIELSDYYLALFKFLGIDRSEKDRLRAANSGLSQLQTLADIGNKYARQMLDNLEAPLEHHKV